MSKNWSPKDLRGTKHLLDEHRALEEARIAKNAAAGHWLPYKPSWTSDSKKPKLNPYRLALDEFETPDDRWSPGPSGKDYSDASEGPGQVTVRRSNYDIEEGEVFSPYDATINYQTGDGGWTCKRRAKADEENTLGFDAEADTVGKMTEAVQAWAGLTTPPPKAVDPTLEAMVQSYLANGGKVHTFGPYKTTPVSRIRFKVSFHPEWAGDNGIPPELRSKKKLFRVRPKNGSKWSISV